MTKHNFKAEDFRKAYRRFIAGLEFAALFGDNPNYPNHWKNHINYNWLEKMPRRKKHYLRNFWNWILNKILK